MISRGIPLAPHVSAGTRWGNADLEADLQLETSLMITWTMRRDFQNCCCAQRQVQHFI